ncbi:hypothetical protein [Paractinoplanes brasiliensis]|uniref:Uncharacterized protein n=1 Tax=Paractinoplanes brasiliensis TaxID=52695 RepID=A0A4R6J807_9ACTN|nr:hypothetical protein [Actinoplanes brasiliensis]TDO31287.1 hypothetical protein C8E87_6700 [Actinoplanes brasiliensis]
MWIWIAVVVVALIILLAVGVRLAGRLDGLGRAALRLRKRQAEAAKLQESAAELQVTVLAVQQRAELAQEHIAALSPSRDKG